MQESFWKPSDDKPFEKRFKMGILTSNRNYAGGIYHWHEVFEIYHVLEGEFTLKCDGTEYNLLKGDTFFVNWCIPHQDKQYSDNAKVYSCRIDDKLLGSVEKDLKTRDLEKVCFRNDAQLTDLFLQLYKIGNANDSSSELEINILFLKIFMKIINENKFNNKPKKKENKQFIIFKQVFIYIKNHLNDNISLDALSSELGLHKNYLCRVFKEVTGYSIVTYFNILRAHKAISMIKSNVPLIEISDSLGFCDYNYFSRAFKKAMGHPPSYYIKNSE